MSRIDFQPDTSGFAQVESSGPSANPAPEAATKNVRCPTPTLNPISPDALRQFYRSGVPQSRMMPLPPLNVVTDTTTKTVTVVTAAQSPTQTTPIVVSAPSVPSGDSLVRNPATDQTLVQPTGTQFVVRGKVTNVGDQSFTGTVSVLGGLSLNGTPLVNVQAMAAAVHKWLDSYDATTGLFTQSQPDYADLTGTPAIHNVIPGGTAGQSLVKNSNADYDLTWSTVTGGGGATASTMAAVTHKWLVSYDAVTGNFAQTQPDWADLTGRPIIPAAGLPVGGATGQMLAKNSGTDYDVVWASPTPARATVSVTTSSLASGATGTGTVTIAKTFSLFQVQVDRACRIRLYSTAAARTADASRAAATPPTSGQPHGVILDLVVDSTITGSYPYTFLLSPEVVGSNCEGSPSASISYAVSNLSGSTSTVAITFTFLGEE